MFKRRKPPTVTLSNDAYARWLRAQRPPLQWFLGLDAETQEQLAILGDARMEDLCIAIGYAVQDPRLAEAGLDAEGNPDSEEELVKRIALGAVDRILGNPSQVAAKEPVTPPPEPLTMGGITRRKEERRESEQATARSRMRLFGREPDPPSKEEAPA